MTSAPAISVNALAGRCLDRLVRDAALLRVEIARGSRGELLVDAGRGATGGIAAGLRMAEICMGGLGTCTLSEFRIGARAVQTDDAYEQSGDRLSRQPICGLETCI